MNVLCRYVRYVSNLCICIYIYVLVRVFVCNVPFISYIIFYTEISLQIVNLWTYVLQFYIEYGCCQHGGETRNEDRNLICKRLECTFLW